MINLMTIMVLENGYMVSEDYHGTKVYCFDLDAVLEQMKHWEKQSNSK